MNQAARTQRWNGRAFGRFQLATARRLLTAGVLGVMVCALAGCPPPPRILTPGEQGVIDRSLVEYPAGYELRRYVTNFTAPTAMAVDADGSLLVAQGERGAEPEIWRIPVNGPRAVRFYPPEQQLIGKLIPRTGWKMYGPIGGMVVVDGNVIVTHHDENDLGVVTALDHKGGHKTLCAGFPAQGDYGLSDIAYDARSGKLWFACGTATNSGVVGLDNWMIGWVRNHQDVHDQPFHDMELFGYKFQTVNPIAGVFGPADIAVTAPFQAFNQSFAIRVKGSPDGKPNGAVYSVDVHGGFPNVEAFGVGNPRAIAFNEFGSPYITNRGMECRGDRAVMNDPDVMVRLPPGQPYLGWPDYSADFYPISDARFQPLEYMIAKFGYPQVRPIIDLKASGLTPPVREAMLETTFPSLSGVNKMAFIPWKEFQGGVVVALSGDRTPFASGGIALPRPVGFKLVRVDLDRHTTRDFVRNVGNLPGSKIDQRNRSLIERPIDVKFGPDGAMYILDEGVMTMKHGREHFDVDAKFSGQIFRLIPIKKPTTQEK